MADQEKAPILLSTGNGNGTAAQTQINSNEISNTNGYHGNYDNPNSSHSHDHNETTYQRLESSNSGSDQLQIIEEEGKQTTSSSSSSNITTSSLLSWCYCCFPETGGGRRAQETMTSNSTIHSSRGLTTCTAFLFLVGELAGTGVFALPQAMASMGYIGVLILALCCIVSCYTGYLLSQSWRLIQSRYKEYRGHVRHPYPVMGHVAFGTIGRLLISVTCNVSSLFSGVLCLLLGSLNLSRFLNNALSMDVSFCSVMLVIGLLLVPCTWFGTPKDFWPMAVGAMLTTSVAVVLALVAIGVDLTDQSHNNRKVHHAPTDGLMFFEAAGTMVLATGGHFAFPTFQNDMKKPSQFPLSLTLAFTILAVMYIPTALLGYTVYGSDVASNVLVSMSPSTVSNIILLLVAIHEMCVFVILTNPSMQHLEEALNFPKVLCWQRVVTRTLISLFLLFVAQSIPRFGAIVSLTGGSAFIIVNWLAPVLFYYRLCSMPGDWDIISIPLHVKAILAEIFVVGVVVGVFATYSSLVSIWGSDFTLPCYLDNNAAGL